MTAECCESFAGTDVRGETIPDSRSCRAKTSSAKWNVTTSNRQKVGRSRVLHCVCHWTRLTKYQLHYQLLKTVSSVSAVIHCIA